MGRDGLGLRLWEIVSFLIVLRNDGGLNFIRVSDIRVGARPRSVHASDLEGDGDIDIVVALTPTLLPTKLLYLTYPLLE